MSVLFRSFVFLYVVLGPQCVFWNLNYQFHCAELKVDKQSDSCQRSLSVAAYTGSNKRL